jgi:RNA polymerase sigma-70 factor (ECF subfamily)
MSSKRDEFESLVREHQSMVYGMAYNFLGDPPLAEEVAQEVFLALHHKLDTLETNEHLLFWLRRTTVHRSIDAARRRKRHRMISLEETPEPAVAGITGDPWMEARLQRLVQALPEKPRMIMVLRYQEDLEPAEIAAVVGMPLATVKSHLQRSLAMLREKLTRCVGEYR